MTGLLDTRLCLSTLRSAAADIRHFTAGLDAAALAGLPEADSRTYRALRGALMEISELAAALPMDVRSRRAEVDWRGWIGLRALLVPDQLRHEMPRLALCVDHDLPILLAALDVELDRAGG